MDIGRGAVDRFRSGEMGNTWMLSNIVDDASKKIKTMDNRVTYGHRRLVHGGDISTRALVDTGATHNFISVDEAKRLGLEMTKDSGWIKAANEVAKAISGVARDVKTKIEGWEGELDLSVVLMDDYKLAIEDEYSVFDKSGAKMMSAMQLESGFTELKQNTSNMSSDVETSKRTPRRSLRI
ncbi:putative retrotransposon gag domain, aspartic peptidase domain protein [Tanacetum coccineum]